MRFIFCKKILESRFWPLSQDLIDRFGKSCVTFEIFQDCFKSLFWCLNLFFVEKKIQRINFNHYYKIYSKFVDRFLIQIRGLFCGQTCWSCWQNCGQILVINSGQILWTNLCTFVWRIFVTDSIDKNTNLDIEILLTEFVDKFVQL